MENKAKYDVTLENPDFDHAGSKHKPKSVLDKIKQIAQQGYAGSKALDYVPLVVQWEAACKAGLIGNRNQLLFCERRMQEFLSLCFIEVSKQHKELHEQHKLLLDGWYRAVDDKCMKHGAIAYPHDTKQQAEQKLEKIVQQVSLQEQQSKEELIAQNKLLRTQIDRMQQLKDFKPIECKKVWCEDDDML